MTDNGAGIPTVGVRVQSILFTGGNADRRQVPITLGADGAIPTAVTFMGSEYIYDPAGQCYRSSPEPTD